MTTIQKDEYVLMADVSKFNKIQKNFKTKEDFEYFILKYDFNYVYIRAGGRGYGEEGNFYTDPDFKMYIEACDYLGIPYGFYYIDEALNTEEVDEEVAFMYNFIKENATINNVLPLVIDIEKYDNGKPQIYPGASSAGGQIFVNAHALRSPRF